MLSFLGGVEGQEWTVVEVITVQQAGRHQDGQSDAEDFSLAGLDVGVDSSLKQSLVYFFWSCIEADLPR